MRSHWETVKHYLLEPLRVFRNLFLAGILVVVPLGITAWIVFKIIEYFGRLPVWLYGSFHIEFPPWLPNYVIGIVLTAAVIAFIGFGTQLYIGRKLLELFEFVVHRIPVVSSMYRGIKQVSEALVGRGNKIFTRVVMIEYPRRGLYSMAFVTADAEYFSPLAGRKLLYLFIATTPNPTSGVFVMVPEEEAVETDLTVEDAMKLVISSGMVAPARLPPGYPPVPAVAERYR